MPEIPGRLLADMHPNGKVRIVFIASIVTAILIWLACPAWAQVSCQLAEVISATDVQYLPHFAGGLQRCILLKSQTERILARHTIMVAYAVNKKNTHDGLQTTAEACAKYLQEHIERKELISSTSSERGPIWFGNEAPPRNKSIFCPAS